MEVSTGQIMVVLNAAISGGELNNVVSQIVKDAYASFEAQAARVTLMTYEMATTKAQIDSIRIDCRRFVQETRDEAKLS